MRWKTETYEMPLDATSLDLGEIKLPATFVAKQRGRPLPEWSVTESRGIALADATLEHFHGKWLVVAFWNSESRRSTTYLLPELRRLHALHRQHDCLRIVAFHTGPEESFDELETNLATRLDLPFPSIIDASHTTVDAWGIDHHPTLLLIEPTGTLVGSFTVNKLFTELSKHGLGDADARMLEALLRSADPLSIPR